MYKIVEKRELNDQTTLMTIEAPNVSKHALAGQFIILRIDEQGERIPLTIADYDREKGLVTIIFQKVGATTKRLGLLSEGDALLDFAGPLGRASEFDGLKKVCVIGGGLGTAIAYPQAKAMHDLGIEVTGIAGFRNKDIIILEEEMGKVCDHLHIATDDGSNGNKGFVTNILKDLIEGGEKFDEVIAIGPLVMMRAVSELTRPYGIKTVVSMNSIMIDGTGMCGGCRVIVGGETKFACVDGPEFDGHLVDFDSAMRRGAFYREKEQISVNHKCRLTGETK
ncbi:MAG: sulfide/dihydroorotate dehydrogenase-like FAD/NAD-binding protein [Clostridia bacterium]|nr:sulfide/dihydroorotate dehydrogenase-like FAD/NAD-binding protein [Clostridia bacterium]